MIWIMSIMPGSLCFVPANEFHWPVSLRAGSISFECRRIGRKKLFDTPNRIEKYFTFIRLRYFQSNWKYMSFGDLERCGLDKSKYKHFYRCVDKENCIPFEQQTHSRKNFTKKTNKCRSTLTDCKIKKKMDFQWCALKKRWTDRKKWIDKVVFSVVCFRFVSLLITIASASVWIRMSRFIAFGRSDEAWKHHWCGLFVSHWSFPFSRISERDRKEAINWDCMRMHNLKDYPTPKSICYANFALKTHHTENAAVIVQLLNHFSWKMCLQSRWCVEHFHANWWHYF